MFPLCSTLGQLIDFGERIETSILGRRVLEWTLIETLIWDMCM